MMQLPATLTLKPATWQRWALMGAIPAVFILVIFIRALMIESAVVWLFLLILLTIFSYAFYAARRQLMSVRLTLEEAGFRYTRLNFDITVAWSDICALKQRERGGKIVSLMVVTRQGKYVMLGGFEKMPEIAGYIESRANDLDKNPALANRLKLNPYSVYVAMVLFGIGVWIKVSHPDPDPLFYLGYLIQLSGFIVFLWLMTTNAGRESPVKHFLKLLAIGIVLSLAAAVLLDYLKQTGSVK